MRKARDLKESAKETAAGAAETMDDLRKSASAAAETAQRNVEAKLNRAATKVNEAVDAAKTTAHYVEDKTEELAGEAAENIKDSAYYAKGEF